MSVPVSDLRLWKRMQEGDIRAFEEIYRLYVKKLYLEINRRVKDSIVSEDLVQDIFLTLWENRLRYQPKGALYPYLYGMMVNSVLNHFRGRRLQPELLELWQLSEGSLLDNFQEMTSESDLIQDDLQFRTLLVEVKSSLSPRLQEVYQLRFEKELSVQEIADQLSVSPFTIYNQLRLIKEKFVAAFRAHPHLLLWLLFFMLLYC